MNTYLAFFDVLGFKEIIYKNSLEEVKSIISNLLRDTQTAVAAENYMQVNPDLIVPDLTKQKVNCLHVSDSIVFWTTSDTEADFLELANVCFTFYWRSLQLRVPLRGWLVHGEIEFQPFILGNGGEPKFYNSSLYGKALVEAYVKSDTMEYAGCAIDKAVVDRVGDNVISNLMYDQKISLYKVPLKAGRFSYEHVFRPIQGTYNEVGFRNAAKRVRSQFTRHSKMEELPDNVLAKLNNTIDFLEHFRETDPNLKRP